jgi:thiosulfate/3-mercaptopyruvate sulfurtransferase
MTNRSVARLTALCLFVFAAPFASAQSYNYTTAQELKKRMDAGTAPLIVDVQNERDWVRGHLPGAISTTAYPVTTPAQREKLKPVLAQILGTSKDVVIVCPSGAEAAENAYKYLKELGVPESRLSIQKGGQTRYPYFDAVRGK